VTLLYVAETLSVMEELNAMGVRFALDDFGTGYSSLSYLALTHPKIIKIDQTFVSPAVESLRNDALLEAIVMLGQKLDMTMLAEGIETASQLERLQHLGCEFGQGFLFSPAVPAEQAALLVGKSFAF
jgi:EAL domain-containing protein (putative c-di-GMP-specific phosphodiesterase class I)